MAPYKQLRVPLNWAGASLKTGFVQKLDPCCCLTEAVVAPVGLFLLSAPTETQVESHGEENRFSATNISL